MILLDLMSQELLFETRYILKIARTADRRYKSYSVPKRKGGQRSIFHPSKELKALQRWLLSTIIEQLPVHPSAMAYRKGQNILRNAAVHKDSAFLLRMDFQEFFPSLTSEDIRHHLEQFMALLPGGWGDEDSELFCSLVCRKDQLTIGAVTSPALSNTLCYYLDTKLNSMATEQAVQYTRYADDLYFSTIKPKVLSIMEQQVPRILETLTYPSGLRLNQAKTYHASKRGNRTVTGLILTSDGKVSLGRPLKRRIRSFVHRWASLNDQQRKSLAGLLAYSRTIEPEFINKLVIKYGLPAVRKAQLG